MTNKSLSECTPTEDMGQGAPGSVSDGALASLVPLNLLSAGARRELLRTGTVIDLSPGETFDAAPLGLSRVVYLIEGRIEICAQARTVAQIIAGEDASHFGLTQLRGRGAQAIARDRTRLLALDENLVSAFMLWIQSKAMHSVTETEATPADETSLAWLTTLLASELFSSIPPGNLHRVFETLEPVTAGAGEPVVRQGEPGVYYYIIREGRFDVTRQPNSGQESYRLAELGPGDSFGEEALVSDSNRNATVTSVTEGKLLRLTKEDFVSLVIQPDQVQLDWPAALSRVQDGAAWLDIRSAEEHANDGLPESLNIPLVELRSRRDELPRARAYVVYCGNGQQSAAACAVLRTWGVENALLDGGLTSVPREPAAVVPPEQGRATDQLSPDPALRQEIVQADAELEAALRLKVEATAARRIVAGEAERTDSVEQRSEKEKVRLRAKLNRLELESIAAGQALSQAQRKRLEADAALRTEATRAEKARAEAAAECERLRVAAQTELAEQQARIKETYERSESRIGEIENQRSALEARFEKERAEMEREFNSRLSELDNEAEQLRQNMSLVQVEGSQLAERIRQDQDRAAAQVRQHTEEELRSRRQHLQGQFAAAMAQIATTKQRVDELQAQREAADAESRELAAMLKEAAEAREQAARAEVQAEQARLAQSVAQAKGKVDEAKAAKEAAERERQALYAELESLRDGRPSSEPDEERVGENTLNSSLSEQEEKLAAAQGAVQAAEQAHQEAQVAVEKARVRSAEENAAEDELRQQLYAEAAAWQGEDEVRRAERDAATAHYQAEIEQAKLDAEARQSTERQNEQTMLSDIQALLNDGDESAGPATQPATDPVTQFDRDTPRDIAERERGGGSDAVSRARAQLERLRQSQEQARDNPGSSKDGKPDSRG